MYDERCHAYSASCPCRACNPPGVPDELTLLRGQNAALVALLTEGMERLADVENVTPLSTYALDFIQRVHAALSPRAG